ncbi:hypothetical protein RKD19_004896 [Streptomyces canus]|uniref:hypothetical protein n=1 Tax=unclassified Streptomyces TaxID=2593676 RepID=UPI000F64A23D|nr:hypothetical protein [Streptomyces sp. RP5T]RRR77776.1 hypothetical protein EHS43_27610 [Streptomyces sp. RP5T]
MSYGYGSAFEMDPGVLRNFITEARALGKGIRAAAAAFESDLQSTANWAGIDDEFYQETAPPDRRDVEAMIRSYYAIADAFDGITEGRFLEIQEGKRTAGNAMDAMDEMKARTDHIGEGSRKR